MAPPYEPHLRRIVHIDMDAFYASVEQRDNPALRGRPVVVGGAGARSVVTAASYEARPFGVRSAMPSLRAQRLCPDATFVPPDFERYRIVSRQIRAIFARYTPLIEPLSLDEAYLDVSEHRAGLNSATAVAEAIRTAIRDELGLTASAGVAPNKFLAKLASDANKPDGIRVVKPAEIDDFLLPLAVAQLPGVGRVTQDKLKAMGVSDVASLRALRREALEARLGRWGSRLFELARGVDDRPVQPNRPRKSISAEDTLAADLPADALVPHIQRMAEKTWRTAERAGLSGRTVVLKLKTADFRILTRRSTHDQPVRGAELLVGAATRLLAGVENRGMRYRLVGVGLSELESVRDGPQGGLFD